MPGPLPASAQSAAPATPDFNLEVRYGVLAGLTGDSATFGQTWNEAVRMSVDYVNNTLRQMGLSDQLKATLVDSQDSEGNAQRGVEAAQKLVTIDHVNVIVGDFFSASTAAVVPAVTVPNQVLEFTGGTNPSLTQLNPQGGPTFLWQPVAADDIQGKVLAKLMSEAFGPNVTVNLGIRNDAYGTGLAEVFRTAWTAQGGTIGKSVTWNPTQPTFDTEAQQLADGNPDAWLIVDFCQTFAKMVGPLQRTGKWDGARTFGSDALTDCSGSGNTPQASIPGMRTVQANTSAGPAFADYQKYFAANVKPGTNFHPGSAPAFDVVMLTFLAALADKSEDPVQMSARMVQPPTPPAQAYTFAQLDQAIQAVLAGQDVHFEGASGPLNFDASGRDNANAYDIWQVDPNGIAARVQTITFTP
jgi:branched-chain amino acid transport system substrate-binding protein